MSNIIPVYGNQFFSAVKSSQDLSNLQNTGVPYGIGQINIAQGVYVMNTTAAGTYSLTDVNGNVLQLPPRAILLGVLLQAPTTLTNGTSIAVTIGATAGAAGNAVTTAQTLAAINNGLTLTTAAYTISTNTFANITTVGTFNSGVVSVHLYFLSPL